MIDDVAVSIQVQLPCKGPGIRNMANSDKESVYGPVLSFLSDKVFQFHARNKTFFHVVNIFNYRVGDNFNFRIISGPLNHDF